jgi:hypothetical protein
MAIIDPDKLAEAAHKLVEHSHGLHLALIVLLAGRLKRDLDDDDWELRRSAETAELEAKARRLIDESGKERTAEAIAAVTGAYEATARRSLRLVHGLRIEATAESFKRPDPATVRALADDLTQRLAATDARILRSTSDAYRQVIGQVTAEGLAGEHTRRRAAQAALDAFADRGITGYVDGAGKHWNLASYTEMATRTAALKASRQGVLDTVRASGRDLVVVGGSSSSCPLCVPWEGRVLSLDGATPGYPALAEAEAAGLHHPNCGHGIDPYVEGLTDTSEIQHGDEERYEARQQQRYLERGIRTWKRREAAALDELSRRRAAAKVRAWQARLREHVDAHDLKRLRYREQTTKAI